MRHLTKVSRTLAIFASVATLSLGAETVFYAKPDAVGAETDGTSWDTATSLTNALALAGANVPASVYVAKGVYRFTSTASVTPGVSIYGGFSGADASETVATRDLKANPTVIYWYDTYWRWALWKAASTGTYVEPRDSFPTQTSGSGTGIPVLNEDGTLNVPSPTDEEVYWYPDRGGRIFSAGSDTAESERSVVVDGLTLVGTLSFTRTSATVRKCRFFGAGAQGSGMIWTSGRNLLVEDTDFEWCADAAVTTVNINTKTLGYAPTVRMRNSSARHMSPCNQHGSGLNIPSGTNIVEDCVFEENYNLRTKTLSSSPAIISGNGYTVLRLSNSSFIGNVISTNAYCLVDLPSYMAAVVSNCLFLSNRVVGDRLKSNVTASILNAGRNDTVIYGCSFVSNVVDRWDAEAPSGATTLPCTIVKCGYVSQIRNCTFEGNRVRATTDVAGVTPIMATVSWLEGGTDAGAIIGNTFCNNDAPTGEFVLDRKAVLRVYNTILWNASDAYVPATNVGTNANSKLTFRNCVVKNYPTDATWLTDCEDNPTGDPGLGELKKVGNILVRYPSTSGSARRKGRPLYYDSKATPNVVYQDAKGNYVRCDILNANQVTAPYAAIPDALGVFAATGKNPDIGSVNAPAAGLLLIVR